MAPAPSFFCRKKGSVGRPTRHTGKNFWFGWVDQIRPKVAVWSSAATGGLGSTIEQQGCIMVTCRLARRFGGSTCRCLCTARMTSLWPATLTWPFWCFQSSLSCVVHTIRLSLTPLWPHCTPKVPRACDLIRAPSRFIGSVDRLGGRLQHLRALLQWTGLRRQHAAFYFLWSRKGNHAFSLPNILLVFSPPPWLGQA